MWKWAELHARTSKSPVYRYFFALGVPPRRDAAADSARAPFAQHGGEIEYAFGNLQTNPSLAWSTLDERISKMFRDYYVNFVNKGNPNGPGIPDWPALESGRSFPLFVFDSSPHVQFDGHRERSADRFIRN